MVPRRVAVSRPVLSLASKRRTVTHRNAGIDLLRAWAIALTLLMHYAWLVGSLLLQRDIERDAISDTQSVGHFVAVALFHSQHGVYLFFVISGYLITQGLLRSPSMSPLRFLRNRAWRLLPCLWVALCASLLISFLRGFPLPSLYEIFANFLTINWAIPKEVAPILTVTWSLFWEWVFYLSAAIALVGLRRSGWSVKALSICAILGVGLAAVILLGGRSWSYLLLFATGATVAVSSRLRDALMRVRWQYVAVYYVAVVAIYAWFAPAHDATQVARYPGAITPHDVYVPCFSVAAAWLIAYLARYDSIGSGLPRLRSAALWLGERSYSVYLWHMPVMFSLTLAVARVEAITVFPLKAAATAALIAALIVLTAAVSEVSFRLLELPYLHQSRSSR
jgi:peptidoglycan/LPS O-acetylase OafA/YrhL